MSKKLHVLVIPFPAQGHVAPLIKLACKLAQHEIKVTFVVTDFIHGKIMSAMPDNNFEEQNHINLVSIPDGLESDRERKDPFKHRESMVRVMPIHLQNLIEKINQPSEDDEKIRCIIADTTVLWALEVAKKMGIRRAAFSPAGIANMALVLHVPKLIEAGVIDANGMPIRDEQISLSKDIPAWSPSELTWSCPGNLDLHKFIFENYTYKSAESVAISDWWITNSFYELEQPAYHLLPNILPIGPLTSTTCPGSFWPEDPTCLSWLDKQPASSVIYVAFGSITIFSKQQLDELALGLELLGQPFLWVLRSDIMNGESAQLLDEFVERVGDRGKIVKWSAQENVLSHPSIACFLSHCGWNSTMEGVSRGIPFLCWPYFADQFHNKSYICETWKVGLSLTPDEHGIITRHEVEAKAKSLLSNDDIKANALKLKELATKSVTACGSSFKNFQVFIEQLKH